MKKIMFAFFPLLVAGMFLRDDSSCANSSPASNHTEQYDGPYVLYRGDSIFVKYIHDGHGTKLVKADSMPTSQKPNLSLTVATDEPGKIFNVKLKSQLQNEEAVHSNVDKQYIVSDIEGNFRAFRRLLQANKIIDENFNWIFGTGHLVLTGDFVDRGDQQTEVLWLIYSLEEKAKAAGGYVHYILGNHEIMNLNGDLRYLNAKYTQNAILLNQHFVTLYNENTELGRWLRTKNVIEKVGDILFCHAGISPAVNKMDLPANEINKLVRPYYADTLYQYTSPQTDILYSDEGPFWYRGYYYGATKASIPQLDSTLSIYKVQHISTGHTVIADTISVLYNGKVLNTDVHHAKGLSEGLLIEKGKYYRTTSIGERFLVLSR